MIHIDPFTHDAYKETYTKDEDFKDMFQQTQFQIHIEEGDRKDDYHFQNYLLYNIDKTHVPKGERMHLIRDVDMSKVEEHFGVGKTIVNLQRYVCWLKMQEYVAQYIKGCILCCNINPNNMKKVLYHPFPITIQPWENISMDFVGGYQPHGRDMTIYLW
jgi:hypothetical protein